MTIGIAQYLAGLLVVATACQWLAWRLKIPSLLLLLLSGFALGQAFNPDDVLGPEFLFSGVNLAVGVILFEGAMTLRFNQARGLGRPILRLCTLTPIIAWALMTGAGVILGIDVRLALLVGAILVVTGPTVINPILRQLRPTRRVSQLLMWEGIIVDPIGAILAVLVYTGIVASGSGSPVVDALTALGMALLVSISLSVIAGFLLVVAMRRHLIPDFLQGAMFLAVAIGVLVASNAVQRESGLLTVTLLGIILANARDVNVDRVKEFKEHLQVLFVGALFVLLAGRVKPEEIVEVAPTAAIFVAILILVVRPLSIRLGLLGTDVSRSERILMMGMAPRGIVAAAVTSIFALEFGHAADEALTRSAEVTGEKQELLLARWQELVELQTRAEQLVPLVFVVIVVTVALYGLLVGRFAENLGLATTQPQGILFAGGAPWVIGAATRLKELDVPTLIVSSDPTEVRAARAAGLRTVRAGILSEHVIEEMDLAGIGSFVGATPDDSSNAMAAREFAHVLGSANCYQVRPRSEDSGSEEKKKRTSTMAKLHAQAAFVPPTDHDSLLERSRSDMRITRTRLTKQFSLEDFRAEHPEAILLFVHNETGTKVVTPDLERHVSRGSIIAMVERDRLEERTKAEDKHARKAEKKEKARAKADENGED